MVPDYPMNLVEVRKIPKEVREKLTSDFRLIAEYAARKQDPDQLEELMEDKVQTINHPEEFLDMLSEVANDKRYKNAKEKILKNEEENVTMCVIAEKLENRGIERGKLLTVCSLVKTGVLSMEDAANFLGITVKEFEEKMSEMVVVA